MTILYGIPNCDTVKKARAWLAEHEVAYTFHDYKKAGVDEDELRRWVDTLGWEKLLNRQGMTFRKLPDEDKTDVDTDKAIRLMLAHPSAIRRPVIVSGDAIIVGFDPARYLDLR
ncbi:ArsC family reductase [Sphingomonas sp. SUN019]|uniref:ArsC family reductase n=1 Tax=Sphingomonas sp. SUN019 TaxID=2937788 RepID=UPI002164BBF7|nr:ArsC family reductase [Sphingomonas sp. SUN019]UVO49789.1 ArsC family reductase [Sphingomonas sp. SUN019]